jgi:DNA-binding HxlR family transcriptional regulator
MALFDLIGRRWTLRVIWELEQAGQPLTFRELRTACGDLSSSVLTRRLHELTQALLIERTSAGYALTSTGAGLVASLEPVLAWARDWSRALSASAGRDQCALELESLIPAAQEDFDLPTGFPDREADQERGVPGNANGGNGLRR